jgi:hypothetical protein
LLVNVGRVRAFEWLSARQQHDTVSRLEEVAVLLAVSRREAADHHDSRHLARPVSPAIHASLQAAECPQPEPGDQQAAGRREPEKQPQFSQFLLDGLDLVSASVATNFSIVAASPRASPRGFR